ncbi:hypothetical protein ISG33_13685 [Glaciecola sp. MH2013]|uniref:hypothetical protein n=1 Tax=Glaciecola sp. MH2013 TaxID=2785524 RepID=UPI00189E1858|nr:hypothetical protein [Glaciecola sp. MH2013]MBF7074452.1 hypothetical protein [Glaciecola sp. MH2013]
MKVLISCACTIVLLSCSAHVKDLSVDFIKIEAEAIILLENKSLNSNDLPSTIKSLEPMGVTIRGNGLFIKMNSFFTSESGLFIPSDRTIDYSSIGQDPEYKRLSENVYSYKIRG